ncbi:hypothetical protein BAUCODRAFT_221393 [Baudoinia panamericana UAMH 10762]|uniref:Uncharacterized protein n=1 Tax=Baudoinia panamericana (strain UAMH 10762) TaxID=717646 RepID=M2MC85_BAUPA|nr:uncharacterized protein BAUCODRAFT_221393 [Baudoinia panamericana UAMH 10762]EMC94121.1 hypothetical protein BAUCODRAFT_221393 [Baudoinia panamericana UAMH 10762]
MRSWAEVWRLAGMPRLRVPASLSTCVGSILKIPNSSTSLEYSETVGMTTGRMKDVPTIQSAADLCINVRRGSRGDVSVVCERPAVPFPTVERIPLLLATICHNVHDRNQQTPNAQ